MGTAPRRIEEPAPRRARSEAEGVAAGDSTGPRKLQTALTRGTRHQTKGNQGTRRRPKPGIAEEKGRWEHHRNRAAAPGTIATDVQAAGEGRDQRLPGWRPFVVRRASTTEIRQINRRHAPRKTTTREVTEPPRS